VNRETGKNRELEKLKQTASAVLDDEATEKEILALVAKTDSEQDSLALEQCWYRYNLVSQALRSNAETRLSNSLNANSLSSGADFLAGVRAGIARLPDHKTVSRPAAVTRPVRALDRIWQWGMKPLTIAASLCLLVVLGFNLSVDPDLGGSSNYAQNTGDTLNPDVITQADVVQADLVDVANDSFANPSEKEVSALRRQFLQSRADAYKFEHVSKNATGIGLAPLFRVAADNAGDDEQ